jgi:hypothetical protein
MEWPIPRWWRLPDLQEHEDMLKVMELYKAVWQVLLKANSRIETFVHNEDDRQHTGIYIELDGSFLRKYSTSKLLVRQCYLGF